MEKVMSRIEVDEDLCKGCGLCVQYCPPQVLELADRVSLRGYHPAALREPERCTGCAVCGMVCPDLAIEVFKAIP